MTDENDIESKQVEDPIADLASTSSSSSSSQVDNAIPDPRNQTGVQDIEATTIAWTTRALIFAYAIIWLTYFVQGMLNGTNGALTPYVTSAFTLHSLTPTVGILSSVIGGVTNLTLAKILDVFGRPQGYLLCIFLATIGLVMMCVSNTVEKYAAAQVFYTVGNNGIQYSLSVFVADTSSLRNRGLMQALVYSPNLITCWLAGPISQGFLAGPGWKWAFGMFAILVPCVTLPLFGLLVINYLKAKKLGLVTKTDSGRTTLQSFFHYSREFDAIALLLISAGVSLFLLPFNLYAYQGRGWSSALVISMLVVGIILIIGFVVWEKFFASISFIPYSLLLDRTVFGACVLSAVLFMSFWLWNSYFSSFLQVDKGLSVEDASYVVQVYTVGSVICGIVVGSAIRYTGRYKPICLLLGIPLNILGLGLMINFRLPDGNIGYTIMCQIFISVAGGTIIICSEIAILAAASHQHTAVCIAVLGMFGNIGGAIGLTVSSAIWQSIFPGKLAEYLPASELPNLIEIYADLNTQLSYPMGSVAREAIQNAYQDAQLGMLIAGTAIWAIGAISVFMWRDINVTGIKQMKGHVR